MTNNQKIRYKLEQIGYSGGLAENMSNGNFGNEFKSPRCRATRESDAIKAGYIKDSEPNKEKCVNITEDPSDSKLYILPFGWEFKFENGRYSLVDERGWPKSKHYYKYNG